MQLRTEARNNINFWVTIISFVIAIVSLALAIYFYMVPQEKREPIFLIEPSRTHILESKTINIAPIKIYRNDGVEIKADLTAVNCYFYNDGKKSIKREDILEQLKIVIDDPSAEIIDYKITSVSRNLTEFNLLKDKQSKNVVLIDFKILEKNDGAIFQLIYTGNSSAQLKVNGFIEGVPAGVSTINRYIQSDKNNAKNNVFSFLIGIISSLVSLAFITSLKRLR